MRLAFALIAAIIGSTGAWATRSAGRYGTTPHRPRPGTTQDAQVAGARATRDAVAQTVGVITL